MGLAPRPGAARVLARRRPFEPFDPFEPAGRDHHRRARPGGHRYRALAGPPRDGSVMTGVLLRATHVTRRFGAFTADVDASGVGVAGRVALEVCGDLGGIG